MRNSIISFGKKTNNCWFCGTLKVIRKPCNNCGCAEYDEKLMLVYNREVDKLIGRKKVVKEPKVVQIRFYPKNTDTTIDGILIRESEKAYYVRNNLGAIVKWNKKYCQIRDLKN